MFVYQQFVDDIICRLIPLARVTILASEVMLHHGVHTFVSNEKLHLLIIQVSTEVRVKQDLLAVSGGSRHILANLERHIHGDIADERMLKNQCGLGFTESFR